MRRMLYNISDVDMAVIHVLVGVYYLLLLLLPSSMFLLHTT